MCWNWVLMLVSDFSGCISVIIEEKIMVIVLVVRLFMIFGKFVVYRINVSVKEAISWMIGLEMEEVEIIFIFWRCIWLLILLKCFVFIFWLLKINIFLWFFSICFVLVVICFMVFCMFLLMLWKCFDIMWIVIEIIGVSIIKMIDSC